jgi:uncharacterized membrane protein
LKFNVLWDGVFHISTYMFTATGMAILWKRALKFHDPWLGKLLVGTILMGFGIFNLVEGIIDHEILGIHHVDETVPLGQLIYWDIGFLVWGALMLIAGCFLWQAGTRSTSETTSTA